MSLQVRSSLKKVVPEGLWPLAKSVDKYVISLQYVYFYLQRRFSGSSDRHVHPLSQSISRFTTDIPLGAATHPGALLHRMTRAGLEVKSGRHSVYLSRREDIERINPAIIQRYSSPVGLKIIASRQMAPDGLEGARPR